jgi:hypothetical protein
LELDQRSPEGGWQMEQSHPAPSQHQESAGDHEQHEKEMETYEQVGQDAVGQGSSEQ